MTLASLYNTIYISVPYFLIFHLKKLSIIFFNSISLFCYQCSAFRCHQVTSNLHNLKQDFPLIRFLTSFLSEQTKSILSAVLRLCRYFGTLIIYFPVSALSAKLSIRIPSYKSCFYYLCATQNTASATNNRNAINRHLTAFL